MFLTQIYHILIYFQVKNILKIIIFTLSNIILIYLFLHENYLVKEIDENLSQFFFILIKKYIHKI